MGKDGENKPLVLSAPYPDPASPDNSEFTTELLQNIRPRKKAFQ